MYGRRVAHRKWPRNVGEYARLVGGHRDNRGAERRALKLMSNSAHHVIALDNV